VTRGEYATNVVFAVRVPSATNMLSLARTEASRWQA
jgi:hypothetical protein